MLIYQHRGCFCPIQIDTYVYIVDDGEVNLSGYICNLGGLLCKII